MNRTMKLFTINAIVAMVSCAGITNHKSNNVWKSLAFFLSQSSSPNKVTMNLTLVGSDGKPLSIGNVSTKTMSESSDSAKPAPDSNVAPAGSGGEKSGGENIQVGMDGGSKALEIMDSNGNYAGTITMTPRTGNETHTNSFLTFALRSESEPAAGAIVGVMTGETIVLDVPFNDLTKLIPIFTHDGASVNISTDAGLKEITTGLSANDFSSKQKYTVLAKNGTKKEYTIIVNKVKYTCELAGIYFTDYPLTAVRQKSDSNSVWYEASLPPNANLNSLKTSFSIYGTSATVAGVPQTSGVSVNNFSRSTGVTFTVNGSNGCSTDYLLKASNESVKAKSLTRGTLDLVNIPEITSVNAIGVPKTRAVIDSTASGYFDDVEGRYFFTKGQVKMMVPYGTPFSNFNLEIQTKNNTRKVLVEGKEYVKGATIVNFLQKNGNFRQAIAISGRPLDTANFNADQINRVAAFKALHGFKSNGQFIITPTHGFFAQPNQTNNQNQAGDEKYNANRRLHIARFHNVLTALTKFLEFTVLLFAVSFFFLPY